MPAMGVEFLALMPLVIMGRITATEMVAIVGALMPVAGIYALLQGVIATDTSALKMAALTGEPQQTLVGRAINAVRPKPK